MHIGVVYPQAEIATDVGAVRAFAARVEELGYHHILAYDHVVGADPAVHTDWRRPYDIDTTFHEPFVLYGFLAGDRPPRAGNRRHHFAAAANGLAGQAGRRGGYSDRGTVPARPRYRVEHGRIRSPGPGLQRPEAGARKSKSVCCAVCGPSAA